jgi:hypothetical protein
MAYRFDGSDDDVRFSMGAFDGYTAGPISGAVLLKRNAASAWHGLICVYDATGADSGNVGLDLIEYSNGNQLAFWNGKVGGAFIDGSSGTAVSDTSNWQIVGVSWNGASSAPRFHWKVGAGSWNHASGADSTGSDANTFATADRIIVGTDPTDSDDLSGDVVCAGMIKANWADGDFEALDMSAFSSWTAKFTGAGAWLVGFEASGALTDRTGNGGDEASRAGTTLVSDPGGWSWAGAGTTYEKDEIGISERTGGGTRIKDILKSGTGIIGP